MTILANTSVIQALNASPMLIAQAVKNSPVAITVQDKAIFYCINEQLFSDFLAWKTNNLYQEALIEPVTQKKSIGDFAGIFKNKTKVRLTIEQMNEAIAQAGANAGMQGLNDE